MGGLYPRWATLVELRIYQKMPKSEVYRCQSRYQNTAKIGNYDYLYTIIWKRNE